MKLIWSPVALKRIEEILEYIALDKAGAAKKWAAVLLGRVEMLKRFPKRGRRVAEVDQPNTREIIFGRYRIIYRIKSGQIVILTVRHGKQQLPLGEIARAQSIEVPDDPMRGPIS